MTFIHNYISPRFKEFWTILLAAVDSIAIIVATVGLILSF